MTHLSTRTATIAAATTLVLIFGPAMARAKHHRQVMRGPAAPPASATPFSFYPNEIDGGVSGNLPFNNQLRKLKDPLNANGAGR